MVVRDKSGGGGANPTLSLTGVSVDSLRSSLGSSFDGEPEEDILNRVAHHWSISYGDMRLGMSLPLRYLIVANTSLGDVIGKGYFGEVRKASWKGIFLSTLCLIPKVSWSL